MSRSSGTLAVYPSSECATTWEAVSSRPSPRSSGATAIPSQTVPSLVQLVTQWMSQVIRVIGCDRSSSYVHRTGVSTRPVMREVPVRRRRRVGHRPGVQDREVAHHVLARRHAAALVVAQPPVAQ